MPPTSFTVSFPIDFWTRYRASRTLMHRLWGACLAYAFFIGAPTAAFIAALVLHWDLSRPGAFGLPGWALLSGGYLFVLVFIPLLQMFQLWAGSRGNRTLAGMQTQSLTPEGFSTSSPTFHSDFKWDAIYKAVETRHFFLLYLSTRAAYYIPKARLTGAADLGTLRTVLKTHLHEKARLRSSV
jgi:hypothetical protein